MNQITFPRKSYFGDTVEKTELEKWFLYGKSKSLKGKTEYNLVENIKKNLEGISSATTEDEQFLLSVIKNFLPYILVCSPTNLRNISLLVDKLFPDIFIKAIKAGTIQYTKFHDDLFDAFNYKSYLKNKLRDLACFLNIKSCPYCNMSYTLFAEDGPHYKHMKNIFQIDHFYGEKKYPFLSMSLYNLIPSCAVCNQKKSDTPLSLNFHPYLIGINKQFHFKVENPLPLIFGAMKDKINVDLELENKAEADKTELEDYDKLFDIKLRYCRHKDIVQEVFDKAYLERYYTAHFFKFLRPKYRQRLIYGVYMDENEIEKRPMSKFIQDIRKQAIDML